MKKIYKISITAFLILLVFCIKLTTAAYAIENKYTNQLLKLNIDKSVNNKINITVVTSKPYKIKLSPIKRSDNEYVIFLPETYHSITTKPDISSITDLQDVDVKLIPYIGSQNNNGYTKITIKTKSPDAKLNINDEILKQEPKINNELSKLINQNITKPKITTSTTNSSSTQNIKNSINNTSNIENSKLEKASRIVSNTYNNAEKNQSKNNTISPPITKPSTTTQKQTIVEQKSTVIEQKPLINETITENTNIDATDSKEPQQTLTTNSPINVNKENLPAKKINKPVKSNNTSIKLILFSLIALLVLFIVVLRYFKSVLSKQMKMAEKKAISNKSEIILPVKQQEPNVNNKAKSNSSGPMQNKKPVVNPATNSSNKKPHNIKVIKGFEIEGNKGIYLIQTKYNQILIGTINSEVFLLKEFDTIQNPNLIVRKEKSLKTKNIYYVQMSNWRSLISVASDNIKLELILDKKTLVTH
ncbi:MAG: hypothetical protein PHC34_00685 [Candidatus Gastranaerophilales bacterium]|nr:hypothetical protein [Candidatus Gastranaerophilales bacterium]